MHCPHCHQPIDDSPAIITAGKDISKWLSIIAQVLAGGHSADEAEAIRADIAKLKASHDALETAINNQTEE